MVGDETFETAPLRAWRRVTDVPLTVIAIGSLPVLLLEFERSSLTYADRVFIDVVQLVVLVAFAIDYVVELVLARDRRRYVRSEWANLVIVVANVAAVLPGLAGFGALRALRGSHLLRSLIGVARLVAITGVATRRGRGVILRHASSFAIALAGLTWITSAVAFTLAEDVGESRRIESFFDGLWWSTTTITTVGYGDVYPVTALGRIVGGFTMLVGISTFAIVTAKVAELLVRADAREAAAVAETPEEG